MPGSGGVMLASIVGRGGAVNPHRIEGACAMWLRDGPTGIESAAPRPAIVGRMASRTQRAAVFASGFFGLGLVPMMTVAVPLWALELEMGPSMIGLALGARAALSVPLSIPGGAVMDRLGINRIMAGAALCSAVAFPLYTVLPWAEALVALQALTGFAQGLLWMGAQAHVAGLRAADPALMGRFTFAATAGNLAAPALCGWAWDFRGPEAAFLCLGAWSAGALATTAFLPRRAAASTAALRVSLPRLADYGEALRMISAPAIGFVVMCSFLMTCTHALRHSFYPVYLDSLGMAGAAIGALVAAGSAVSGLSGLAAGPAARRANPNALLIGAVALTALCVSQVVLFETFWSLFGMALLWGLAAGLAFPLTLYVLARAVGSDRQGMSIGVRTTVNRLAGLLVPIVLGAAIEWIGLRAGFYAFAACVLGALGLTAWRLLPGARAAA